MGFPVHQPVTSAFAQRARRSYYSTIRRSDLITWDNDQNRRSASAEEGQVAGVEFLFGFQAIRIDEGARAHGGVQPRRASKAAVIAAVAPQILRRGSPSTAKTGTR
jgi:hypothetical protein